jgi:hypothetical protein
MTRIWYPPTQPLSWSSTPCRLSPLLIQNIRRYLHIWRPPFSTANSMHPIVEPFITDWRTTEGQKCKHVNNIPLRDNNGIRIMVAETLLQVLLCWKYHLLWYFTMVPELTTLWAKGYISRFQFEYYQHTHKKIGYCSTLLWKKKCADGPWVFFVLVFHKV